MVTELKAHGIILHLHICGDTARITDDFIATGAQVLEIDHKTDAARIKHAALGRTMPARQHRHRPAGVRARREKSTPPVVSSSISVSPAAGLSSARGAPSHPRPRPKTSTPWSSRPGSTAPTAASTVRGPGRVASGA